MCALRQVTEAFSAGVEFLEDSAGKGGHTVGLIAYRVLAANHPGDFLVEELGVHQFGIHVDAKAYHFRIF